MRFVAIQADDSVVAGKEGECTQPHTSGQCTFSPSTSSGNQNTALDLSLGLKSPTSWSIKGVKVYDEKEVDVAIGRNEDCFGINVPKISLKL